LRGSIALRGVRIDDLSLVHYHQTVDRRSPEIILFSPTGTPAPYFAEFGWVDTPKAKTLVPGPDTEWKQEGSGALEVGRPVTLVYDDGTGVIFKRTFSIDANYLISSRS
jgi:YidC/Oxa1 family membrane protein insertase